MGLGFIWPMSIAMQALTSTLEEEKLKCIELLLDSTAGTGFIHEAFWMDKSSVYTRDWFAWANALVGELLYDYAKQQGCLLP